MDEKKATDEIKKAIEEADFDIRVAATASQLPIVTTQLATAVVGVCDDLKLSRRQRILVVASMLSALTDGEDVEFQYAIAATSRFFDFGRQMRDEENGN